MPLSDTQCRGLLSFVCSWSPRIQGSAWYIVGAQEILVIEDMVPSLRFFLLWVSISINAHEKVLNRIFYIKININRNRGFDTQIYKTTTSNIFYQWYIKHNWLEWIFCLIVSLPVSWKTFFYSNFIFLIYNFFFIMETFKWNVCSHCLWA